MTESVDSAALAVAALVEHGVRHVVVSPGSRSAPLAYVLAAAEASGALTLHVRIDERDAGFTALGLALGSRRPVAVVTTSGTAVGNLMPAVMEANHSEVPLVVLSADRPQELRGTGANQTTRQAGLFGSAVRYEVDISAGADPSDAVAAAVEAARGAPSSRLPHVPGPVQINIAFRDPLVPRVPLHWPDQLSEKSEGQSQSQGQDQSQDQVQRPVIDSDAQWRRVQRPDDSFRTVVIAGAGAGKQAAEFAAGLGLPLCAEPSSGARYGAAAVGPYRLLLEHFGAAIERVVLFGRPTLSRQVSALLARRDVKSALYEPVPVGWYSAGRRREQAIGDLQELADFAGAGPHGWLKAWQLAASRAEAALEEVLAKEPGLTGVQLARSVWRDAAERGGQLVLGSSNPVRDVELAGRPGASPVSVFANRGLAGIDGMVATATGIALSLPAEPTRVLLGDLTLLHDAGGLLIGTGEAEPNLQIVVLNDGGGGIFSILEHGQLGESEQYHAAVERFFGTPHQTDLAALARAYGIPHQVAADAVELDQALAAPISGRSMLEVRAVRTDLRALHRRLREAVAARVGDAANLEHL